MPSNSEGELSLNAESQQSTAESPELTAESKASITRREAVRRVTAMLGGVALVGGNALLTGCRDGDEKGRAGAAASDATRFSAQDVAFLDEVADTILPPTKTPGAKAARTGAFMALMVTDTYDERDQRVFRDGMKKLDEASRKANNAAFMSATPQQRLTLLESLDREQKSYTDAREKARTTATRPGAPKPPEAKEKEGERADARLPDQRKENAPNPEVSSTPGITADSPAHYFRMMKELALLGYFTSEIGYNQAMRYVESPGRFDPCVPYKAGERAWAPHA